MSFHEFAHSVRHAFDGDTNHFNWDVTRFVYARNHSLDDDTNEGFAFNEGWAEFWAGDTAAFNNPLNMEVEGDVAHALSQLAACREVGKVGMLRVLQQNPGTIHSFSEFQTALSRISPSACVGVIRQPEHVSEHREQLVLSSEQQTRLLTEEITAQLLMIEDLRARLSAAETAAADVPMGCADKDCLVHFNTVLRPFLLKASIEARTLAIVRLRELASSAEEGVRRLKDGTFDEWYNGRKKAYLASLWNAHLPRIREAVVAVDRLERSEAGKALVKRLKSKLQRFEQSRDRGDPPPLGMQPAFLWDEKMHSGTR